MVPTQRVTWLSVSLSCYWISVSVARPLGCDNFPLILFLKVRVERFNVQRWHFKKANLFQSLGYERFNAFSEHDPDPIKWFTSILTSIANDISPKTSHSVKHNCLPWFNDICKNGIKECKKAERSFFKSPTTENLIKFKIINEAKRQSWRQVVSSISSKTSMKKVWNLICGMMGKNYRPQIQHIKHQDKILTTKQETANTIAECFWKKTSYENCLPAFQAILAAGEKKYVTFSSDNLELLTKENPK